MIVAVGQDRLGSCRFATVSFYRKNPRGAAATGKTHLTAKSAANAKSGGFVLCGRCNGIVENPHTREDFPKAVYPQ
jgi:hypothetical protein